MKKILVLLPLLLLVDGCNFEFLPDYDLPLYEQIEIKGTVMLSNVFTGTNAIPAKDAVVFLSSNSTASPYLYKITADRDGIFTFPYKPDGQEKLHLIGRYTDTAGLTYEGNLDLTKSEESTAHNLVLTLNPVYPGGILKVIVQDADPAKQPVNGVDVYLFTNDEQAASINVASPTGYVQRNITNEKGVAFFSNLKTADYIIVGKTSNQFTDRKTQEVLSTWTQAEKLSRDPLPLTLQPSTSKGRIRIIVTDEQTNDLLANVSVYLFTSRVQAETIYNKNNGPNGFIDMQVTSAKGEVFFENLATGRYHVAIAADFSETNKPRQIGVPVMVAGDQAQPAELEIPVP